MKNTAKIKFGLKLLTISLLMVLVLISFSNAILLKVNEYKVNKIVNDYYKIHTYSSNDLFACLDMTIDLWNIYKTAGYNAKIALGNLLNESESIEEINHAWLMVEISPFKWIAVETTQGRTIKVWENSNAVYYGDLFSFHNPAEVRKYIELREIYLDKLYESNKVEGPRCIAYRENILEYNQLVVSYNLESSKSLLGNDYDAGLVQSILDKLNALKEKINYDADHCKQENINHAQNLSEMATLVEKLALLLL